MEILAEIFPLILSLVVMVEVIMVVEEELQYLLMFVFKGD
jgi:hypothetical protein